jgi:hypothetical protein
MVRCITILTCLSLSSCSIKKFYPLGGAVVGGSAGSIGGPVSAGLAAGAGWTVGELAKGDADLREAQQTIKALTTGDVDTLVQRRLEDARNNGFFDGILDEVYGLLKICVIGLSLWVIIPLLYTRHVHKKQKEKDESDLQHGSQV